MKSSIALLLALPALALASANNPTLCAADNCARAVTGTAKGTAHVTTARADCSSFMQQTVTEATRYAYVDSSISTPSIHLRICYNSAQSVTSQQSILTYSTLYNTTTITDFVTVTAAPAI